MTGSENGNRK